MRLAASLLLALLLPGAQGTDGHLQAAPAEEGARVPLTALLRVEADACGAGVALPVMVGAEASAFGRTPAGAAEDQLGQDAWIPAAARAAPDACLAAAQQETPAPREAPPASAVLLLAPLAALLARRLAAARTPWQRQRSPAESGP